MDPYKFTHNKYYDADYTYSGNQFSDHINSAVANSMGHEHSSAPFLYQDTDVDLTDERVRETHGLNVPLGENFSGSCEGLSESLHSLYDVPTFSTNTVQDVCSAKEFGYDTDDVEDNSLYFSESDVVPNRPAYYLASANIVKECDMTYPVAYPEVTDQCMNSVELTSVDSDSSQLENYSQGMNYSFDQSDREFIEALVVKLAEKSVIYAESRDKGKGCCDLASSTTEVKSIPLAHNKNISAEISSASSLNFDKCDNYDNSTSDKELYSFSHDEKASVPSDVTESHAKHSDVDDVSNIENCPCEQNVEDAVLEEVPYHISEVDSGTHQSTTEGDSGEADSATALSPEEALKYFLETNCLNVTSYKILDSNGTIKEIRVTSDWFPEAVLDVNDEEQVCYKLWKSGNFKHVREKGKFQENVKKNSGKCHFSLSG